MFIFACQFVYYNVLIMKRMRLLSVVLSLLCSVMAMAQFESMELPGQTSCLRIYDNKLYAATNDGVYCCDVGQSGGWSRYGFSGLDVQDFVKNDETMLVKNDLQIFRSTDNGKTYHDVTNEVVQHEKKQLALYRFAQVDNDPKRLFMTYSVEDPNNWGLNMVHICRSDDGGLSWTDICPLGGTVHSFVTADISIDPADENHIIVWGGDNAMDSEPLMLFETFDGFTTTAYHILHDEVQPEIVWPQYISDMFFFGHEDEMVIANNPFWGMLTRERDGGEWGYANTENGLRFIRMTDCVIDDALYGLSIKEKEERAFLQMWRSTNSGKTWLLKASQDVEGQQIPQAPRPAWQMTEKAGVIYIFGKQRIFYYMTEGATGIREASPLYDKGLMTKGTWYSLDGRQQSARIRGLNIVREADGSVRKVIVR